MTGMWYCRLWNPAKVRNNKSVDFEWSLMSVSLCLMLYNTTGEMGLLKSWMLCDLCTWMCLCIKETISSTTKKGRVVSSESNKLTRNMPTVNTSAQHYLQHTQQLFCWIHVTAVARKRPRSSCQKRRWQVTAKHAYTLRMWLCMKWHGAWLYGVHRTCAEMAAVSCGTSHASAVSTPLRWIFKKKKKKKRAIKSLSLM